MSQEDYDQGYEAGRQSMAAQIAGLEMQLEWARKDLEAERAERRRYKELLYARTTGDGDAVPF